jgi:hypothetical protein
MSSRLQARVMAALLFAGALLVLVRGARPVLVLIVTPLALVTSYLVLPKSGRPWAVAALLVGLTRFVPRTSFFWWAVPTMFLVVMAAWVLARREPDSYRE